MDGHMGRVFSLKYHPSDPRVVVSAGWDDTVQFWDTRSKHSVRYTLGSRRGGASRLGHQGGEGPVDGGIREGWDRCIGGTGGVGSL